MSLNVSFAATLPTAILETILTHLAALFLTGAGGDMAAARQAVIQMLAAYRPETEDELRLAANIIGFSFQALEALGQSATPDMPLTRILRLRSSAVSLSRESHKAERRLTQLQKARQEAIPERPVEAQSARAPAETKIEPLSVKDNRNTPITAKTHNLTSTQAEQQREQDARIAASLRRAEARVAAQTNIAQSDIDMRVSSPVPHNPPTSSSAAAYG